MNFADNWARVFVVITFLTLGEAQIIGGIVPHLIAFGLFLGANRKEIKESLNALEGGKVVEI